MLKIDPHSAESYFVQINSPGCKTSDVDLYYMGKLLSDSKMLVEYNFSQAVDEPFAIKFAVKSGMGIALDPSSDLLCSF